MGIRRYVVIICTLAFGGYSHGHSADSVYDPGLMSFEVVTDPRSIALGESGVADKGNLAALGSNPANLAHVSESQFLFNHRPYNLWDDRVSDELEIENLFSRSLGCLIPFDFGHIAVTFNRSEYGRIESENGVSLSYDQTFSLTYGKQYGRVGIGSTVKAFNKFLEVDSSPGFKAKYIMGADFGVVYYISGPIRENDAGDTLTLGVAIQNLATSHDVREQSWTLPLYLRMGFKYEFDYHPLAGWTPFKFAFSGEYRRFLNRSEDQEPKVRYGTYYEGIGRDFGGVGFEVTLYELLSLRMGGIFFPRWSSYGDRKRLSMRHGVGVTLPNRFSTRSGGRLLPQKLTFDYAAIPVNQSIFNHKTYLHSFGVRLFWHS